MKYRLSVLPALEKTSKSIKFSFESRVELMAAKNTAADLLLFLQDKINVMPDFSNVITAEVKVDGEWEELDEVMI